MRRALHIAGATLQGAVIAAALAAATILVLPRALGWQLVTVMSGSMAPAYRTDAVLAVAPVDPADVREGDVIAFETEADRPLVTHRVVAVERETGGLNFVTKGDANEEADRDPVAATAVRGRVVFGVPYMGAFVRVVDSTFGFALLLALPGVLLIAQEIASIRRDRQATKDWQEWRAWRDSLQQAATNAPWVPPLAADCVPGPDPFDFWTTMATEDRYYDELDRQVRAWRHSNA